jgi:phage baseplate assembly protein W
VATTDYGRDLAMTFGEGGTLDLDPTGALVSGVRAVAESVARRLTTRRGSLLGAPDYGLDVRYFLGDSFDPAGVFALESAVVDECGKEERVRRATCAATLDAAGALSIEVDVESDVGPFSLVLSVGQVTLITLQGDNALWPRPSVSSTCSRSSRATT